MRRQTFIGLLTVVLTIVLLSLTLVSSAWAAEYKVLYKFQGGADGYGPEASLILDAAGNLYGTTGGGGAYGLGTAFKLSPNPDGSWSQSVIYSFGHIADDGSDPEAGLIFDAAGNLYGTTFYGGAYSKGTVFKLSQNPDGSWSESVIYSFSGADGAYPYASLILDAAGNLYGTTMGGGDPNCSWAGCGVVFKLTPNPDGSWSGSVVHSFIGADGFWPEAGLIFDAAGNLYGTTAEGGADGLGTAFKLRPNPDGSWTRSKLHVFRGADGANPISGLIFDAAGNLYGTTIRGGAYDRGSFTRCTRYTAANELRRTSTEVKGESRPT